MKERKRKRKRKRIRVAKVLPLTPCIIGEYVEKECKVIKQEGFTTEREWEPEKP